MPFNFLNITLYINRFKSFVIYFVAPFENGLFIEMLQDKLFFLSMKCVHVLKVFDEACWPPHSSLRLLFRSVVDAKFILID